MFDQHPFLVVGGPYEREVGDFIGRFGGHITRTIGLQTRLRPAGGLIDVVQRLCVAAIDAMVFLTAGGVRHLFLTIRGHYDQGRLQNSLSDAQTFAAGPHVADALAEWKVQHIPLKRDGRDWRELVVGLQQALPLANCTIGLEQTIHHIEIKGGLEARGAIIVDMPILGAPLRNALGENVDEAAGEPWPTTAFVFDSFQLQALADDLRLRPASSVEDMLVLSVEPWLCETAEQLGFRARHVNLSGSPQTWGNEAAQEVARYVW